MGLAGFYFGIPMLLITLSAPGGGGTPVRLAQAGRRSLRAKGMTKTIEVVPLQAPAATPAGVLLREIWSECWG
jgi:hypothetical protein